MYSIKSFAAALKATTNFVLKYSVVYFLFTHVCQIVDVTLIYWICISEIIFSYSPSLLLSFPIPLSFIMILCPSLLPSFISLIFLPTQAFRNTLSSSSLLTHYSFVSFVYSSFPASGSVLSLTSAFSNYLHL